MSDKHTYQVHKGTLYDYFTASNFEEAAKMFCSQMLESEHNLDLSEMTGLKVKNHRDDEKIINVKISWPLGRNKECLMNITHVDGVECETHDQIQAQIDYIRGERKNRIIMGAKELERMKAVCKRFDLDLSLALTDDEGVMLEFSHYNEVLHYMEGKSKKFIRGGI